MPISENNKYGSGGNSGPEAEDRSGEQQQAKHDDKDCRHDEIGGPAGPEPTRFGDWERKGRCIDF